MQNNTTFDSFSEEKSFKGFKKAIIKKMFCLKIATKCQEEENFDSKNIKKGSFIFYVAFKVDMRC